MDLEEIRFRPATPRDTMAVAELVAGGFATYREFIGPRLPQRTARHEEPEIRVGLTREETRSRLAIVGDGRIAGFCAWLPAEEGDGLNDVGDRARLWMLFVAPTRWGTGLARDLLAWAVEGMREAGFAGALLWTPAAHARARAFYEREGWTVTERRRFASELGLDLVLLERALR